MVVLAPSGDRPEPSALWLPSLRQCRMRWALRLVPPAPLSQDENGSFHTTVHGTSVQTPGYALYGMRQRSSICAHSHTDHTLTDLTERRGV